MSIETRFIFLLSFCLQGLLLNPAFSSETSPVSEVPAFDSPSPLILGGAGYLKGVGLIYGGALGAKKIVKGHSNVLLAASGGAVNMFGVLVNEVPIISPRFKMAFGFGKVNEAEFETSYARGLDESLVVRQKIKARGSLIGFKFALWPQYLDLKGSLANSWVRFIDFETLGGTTIPFQKRDLHDIETQATNLGLVYHLLNPKNSSDHKLEVGVGFTDIQGRLAQSDNEIWSFRTKGVFTLVPSLSLATTAQFQRTSVTNESGPGGPNGNCNVITDENLKKECLQLQSDLTKFISASNKYGTAVPTGGSRGLRSYRELRFRAANTGLFGLELRKDIEWKYQFQVAAFYELGQAADLKSELFDHSVQSYGLGLRLLLDETPVRLEFAGGDSGTAALLTVGYPW